MARHEESTHAPRTSAWAPDESERDACAIIANVKKDGRASHGNVKRTLEALARMGHRTGGIAGEGDGSGLQTDIPRDIWARWLEGAGFRGSLATRRHFTVAHVMIPHTHRGDAAAELKARGLELFGHYGFEVLVEGPAHVRPSALGPLARASEPEFWQIAALPRSARGVKDSDIFNLQLHLERELPVHVASLSQNNAVYKVRGDVETLRGYFPELSHPDFTSAITLAHARYSTNTESRAERAQMFSTLGHNGEINSLDRLGRESLALGFQLPERASDSQILDRLVESLMFSCDLSLMSSLEIAFPPVWSEVSRLPDEVRELYRYWRRAFGAHAQGPAAIIARQGDEIVFSCDALGLRPLWFGETEKEFFASSERGVVPLIGMVRDPRPLGPGEKMGLLLERERGVRVFEYHELVRRAVADLRDRFQFAELNGRVHWLGEPATGDESSRVAPPDATADRARLAALGWNKLDAGDVDEMAGSGKEPISGLGWDGPLAALSAQRKNVSDYFHERVAVVTNPAVDREREADHFSTRIFLGAKPPLAEPAPTAQIELGSPLVLGGATADDETAHRAVARALSTRTLSEVLELCRTGKADSAPAAAVIDLSFGPEESLGDAAVRIAALAAYLVRDEGAAVLVLDDSAVGAGGRAGIDPHLAVAAIDRQLRDRRLPGGESLRRLASIVLRSGAIRNVHDICLALGIGADAVNPYAAYEVATRDAEGDERERRLRNYVSAAHAGVEKVLSTMGIHELDGYGRLFASVGLAPDLAEYFGVTNYCGSEVAGLGLERLEADARDRVVPAVAAAAAGGTATARVPSLPNEFREQPTIWNAAGKAARGEQAFTAFSDKVREVQSDRPVAIRHLFEVRAPDVEADAEVEVVEPAVAPEDVDTRAGGHAAPFYISAMSFGSQGETSFRAFAEAARRLDIICVNGEGGELPELIGKYPHHRGQQVASGRFGVNARLLNSCDLIEIKIGQGAKPGEGGMLPAFKVTARIAETRHTPPGIDLISPSNNHDIYSIEDLAQVVEELKTLNPRAKVSVKVPSVPNLGPIATGIAKARADVIAISGYDGGTGAARKHSLRHTGLPVEIGLRDAHRSLVRSGLRSGVELWADGGVKSGHDVVKLMLLGADRVGFGTMAMAAIGCTSCRECNTGTCHVGITSQLISPEEALAAGQKKFTPRDYEHAVEHLIRFFTGVLGEIRVETARAGLASTRDLVGRADLLEQARGLERLDLSDLLAPGAGSSRDEEPPESPIGYARRSQTSLTRDITRSIVEMVTAGKEVVLYDGGSATSTDRAIGTHLSGAIARAHRCGGGVFARFRKAVIDFADGSVAGNGLAAFNVAGVDVIVRGGAQDGVAKGASGGRVVVLKGINHDGLMVDGSVGKCFAYGAQAGLFIVQGDADSRAAIRLSGADVIFGGRLRGPVRDDLGHVAARANIKGFAFEYMTSGRGLVLGDPGPWLCSGMTGGVVYVLTDDERGLTREVIERRLAAGAKVKVTEVPEGESGLVELLGEYSRALRDAEQYGEADEVERLLEVAYSRFVKIAPVRPASKPLPVATEVVATVSD